MGDRAEALRRFSEPDPNDNAERMLTHVIAGVAKEQSRTVHDAETSRLWDRLSAGVAAITARVHMPDYTNDPGLRDSDAEY